MKAIVPGRHISAVQATLAATTRLTPGLFWCEAEKVESICCQP